MAGGTTPNGAVPGAKSAATNASGHRPFKRDGGQSAAMPSVAPFNNEPAQS